MGWGRRILIMKCSYQFFSPTLPIPVDFLIYYVLEQGKKDALFARIVRRQFYNIFTLMLSFFIFYKGTYCVCMYIYIYIFNFSYKGVSTNLNRQTVE